MNKVNCFLCLATLLFVTQVWSKGDLPDYYPQHFDKAGVFQDIDSDGRVIINATAYTLGSNAVVHTLRDEYGSINNLRDDMELGFNMHNPSSKRKVITEIWILPNGSIELD
jgi:hypothetical protein